MDTHNGKIIYLDNAATSFPKPENVYIAVDKAMREESGNPGRSGHKLSLSAGRIIDGTRMMVSRLFNASISDSVVFTYNTTMALNMALKGILLPGDHVITSTIEHNSVSRPLYNLSETGVEVTKIHTDISGGLNVEDIKKNIKNNTKLLVCTHISNVTGTVNDISTIGAFCKENGIIFLVDAAQSAGVRKIDIQEMNIDLLAFPGHKGLLGPQGTGGLCIRKGIELNTIIQGGTGSNSESLYQPETFPEKLESGTPNTPGLSGLSAGISFVLEEGIEKIEERETLLTNRLIEGLCKIDGIEVLGPEMGADRGSVVSICLDKTSPAEVGIFMDSAFGIAVRSGLHCAADAHNTIGTLSRGGTVRISPGYFNSEEDIDQCLCALELCSRGL